VIVLSKIVPSCINTTARTFSFSTGRVGITYLLIPWSRVLEKLTGFLLVKKFPAFYGSRRFITIFTGARHLPLS
jgi:hypothetical protein